MTLFGRTIIRSRREQSEYERNVSELSEEERKEREANRRNNWKKFGLYVLLVVATIAIGAVAFSSRGLHSLLAFTLIVGLAVFGVIKSWWGLNEPFRLRVMVLRVVVALVAVIVMWRYAARLDDPGFAYDFFVTVIMDDHGGWSVFSLIFGLAIFFLVPALLFALSCFHLAHRNWVMRDEEEDLAVLHGPSFIRMLFVLLLTALMLSLFAGAVQVYWSPPLP